MYPLLVWLLLPLTLSWIPGDTRQTGFRIWYGTGAGTYESSLDVGNVTKVTHDFDLSKQVCFVARAYNDGGESPNSNEVCKALVVPTPTPTPSTLAPPKKPITLSVKILPTPTP